MRNADDPRCTSRKEKKLSNIWLINRYKYCVFLDGFYETLSTRQDGHIRNINLLRIRRHNKVSYEVKSIDKNVFTFRQLLSKLQIKTPNIYNIYHSHKNTTVNNKQDDRRMGRNKKHGGFRS